MSDGKILNIETKGKKFLSVAYTPDGDISLQIRYTKEGFNLLGDCVITKDRLQMISDFLNQNSQNA